MIPRFVLWQYFVKGNFMQERIVYKNSEGGVSITTPVSNCGLTLNQIAEKDVPKGTPYRIVKASEVPIDRSLRLGWYKTLNKT